MSRTACLCCLCAQAVRCEHSHFTLRLTPDSGNRCWKVHPRGLSQCRSLDSVQSSCARRTGDKRSQCKVGAIGRARRHTQKNTCVAPTSKIRKIEPHRGHRALTISKCSVPWKALMIEHIMRATPQAQRRTDMKSVRGLGYISNRNRMASKMHAAPQAQ